jgi:hypothetical protein
MSASILSWGAAFMAPFLVTSVAAALEDGADDVVTPAPPSAPPPAPVGTIHVTSDRPGTVVVDGTGYGPAPADVHQVPAGEHEVVLVLESSDKVRRVVVHEGEVTNVEFRRKLFYGLGVEPLAWALWWDGPLAWAGGARVVGRLDIKASRALELRADLACALAYGDSLRLVSPTIRFDTQLNVNSVYSMAFGVDLGATFVTGTYSFPNLPGSATFTETKGYLTLGVHASLLTLRFGDARQFVLAAQEGFLVNAGGPFSSGGPHVFEQSVAFGYLF